MKRPAKQATRNGDGMERTVTSLPMTLATVLEAPTRMVDVSTAPRHSGLRLMFVDTFRHSIIALLYATLIQYKLYKNMTQIA